jgi:hypothetical protein
MQELSETLNAKIREVMQGCSHAKVLKEGAVQPHILDKAR